MKAANFLLGKGSISDEVILMFNELYLQKLTQYQCGNYVGANIDGVMLGRLLVFMIVGLKKSVLMVIRAVPETAFSGEF